MASHPLVVNITDLVRHPGTTRPVQRSVALDGLAISTAAVPPDAEVSVDLVLEAISNGLVATGTVAAPWVGECRRCLAEVRGEAVSDVREIFERHATEGETYLLGDELVDLEPMVRDAVLLALPLAPLCRDDCLGPAPDAFPAQIGAERPAGARRDGAVDDETDETDEDDENDAGDDDSAGPVDPRWAALDQLKFD